jgi:recombinational DNA repair ATPase RecF
MNDLRLASIDVRDVGGVQHFAAQMSAINIIVGENGTGKTSLLAAIDSVFSGGHDPDLIRQGAEKAIIVLTLTDGTIIRKTIKAKDSELEILTSDGGKKRAPASYLKELASGIAFDPVAFLEAEPKQRAKFLLDKLPLHFTVHEINEALDAIVEVRSADLARFNEIRDGAYSKRTDICRRFRDVEGVVTQMQSALPSDDSADWSAKRDALQQQIATIKERMEAVGYEVEAALREKVSALTSGLELAVSNLREEYEKNKAHASAKASDLKNRELKVMEDQARAVALELGEVRQKAEQQARAAGVREALELNCKQLSEMNMEEMRLTRVIKALDELKHRKLKELPVAGLDIRIDKGQPVILIDNIPLDKINRQQQIFCAIQVAVAAGLGRLSLMICEAAELSDTYVAELTTAAKAAKLQLVLARWKNGAPLAVEEMTNA